MVVSFRLATLRGYPHKSATYEVGIVRERECDFSMCPLLCRYCIVEW